MTYVYDDIDPTADNGDWIDPGFLNYLITSAEELGGEAEANVKYMLRNQERLARCTGHRFLHTAHKPGSTLECANCSGRLDAFAAMSYLKGWEHAGGNPMEVWPQYVKAKTVR